MGLLRIIATIFEEFYLLFRVLFVSAFAGIQLIFGYIVDIVQGLF